MLKSIWARFLEYKATEIIKPRDFSVMDVNIIYKACLDGCRSPEERIAQCEEISILFQDRNDEFKNEAMKALVKAHSGMPGGFKKAFKRVQQFENEGFFVTPKLLTMLVDLYCSEHGPQKGDRWIRENEIRNMNGIRGCRGFVRNSDMCNTVLASYISINDLNGALTLVDSMKLYGVRANLTSLSLLLKAYVRRNDLSSATKCLDAIIANGWKPTRTSFESVINGHLNHWLRRRHLSNEDSANELSSGDMLMLGLREASKLFKQMRQFNYEPSSALYHMLMLAHFRLGRHEDVSRIFSTMFDSGVEPDLYCYSTYIQSVLACGDVDEAEATIRDMKESDIQPDIVLLTILLHGFGKAGELEKAIATFREIEALGSNVSEVTYCALLHALCLNGDMVAARKVLDTMLARGVRAKTLAYNTMMQGYGLLGDNETAYRLFDEMVRTGVNPSVYTFNILISSQVRSRNFDGALMWFERLLSHGLEPSLVTYNIMINNYARKLNLHAAVQTYNDLLNKGLKPDDATYSPLILAYLRRGEPGKAREFAKDLKEAVAAGKAHVVECPEGQHVKHEPSMPHNIFIKCFYKAGNLEAMVEEYETLISEPTPAVDTEKNEELAIGRDDPVPPLRPDIRTFDLLVRAFGALGDIESSQKWFEAAKSSGLKPDTRLYNALLSAYIKVGDAETVRAKYKEMVDEGVQPDIFTFTLLMRAHQDGDQKNEIPGASEQCALDEASLEQAEVEQAVAC
ncbi:hypothetical protein HDU96_011026 [Phlyctochytrium bullatum]|nr:hypothetical protein HDU96_011026 [Phlyctochytrium bullatum]